MCEMGVQGALSGVEFAPVCTRYAGAGVLGIANENFACEIEL